MIIRCTYKEMLPIKQLSINMIKTLKTRTVNSINGEIRRLLEYGFLTPVFVWKNDGINEVIDGAGRIMAINRINESLLGIGSNGEIQAGIGEKTEAVPVVYIEAETIEEAKKKAILVNSMFGKIDQNILEKYSSSSGESADFIKCHQSFFEIDTPVQDTPSEAIGVDTGFEVNMDDILNAEVYTPTFDSSFIDEEDIKTAEKKIKNVANREPKQMTEITCKYCGHTFTIGK